MCLSLEDRCRKDFRVVGAWMELFEEARETEDSVMEGLLLRCVDEVVEWFEAFEKKPIVKEEGGSE